MYLLPGSPPVSAQGGDSRVRGLDSAIPLVGANMHQTQKNNSRLESPNLMALIDCVALENLVTVSDP